MGKWIFNSFLMGVTLFFFTQCTTKQSKPQDVVSLIETVPTEYVDMPEGYKVEMSDFIFIYDNVSDRNEVLVSYLNQQKALNKAMSILPIGDTTLASLNILDTIPNNVFKAFAEYNSVNMWAEERDSWEHPRRKDEVVNGILNDNVAIYCGQVMLSDSFDSFMFLLNDTAAHKYGWNYKDLFVINMKNDAITSVAKLFVNERTMVQSAGDSNNVFHLINYSLTIDPCYPEYEPGVSDEYDFKYDQDGQLVILRCPIDYIEVMNRRIELRSKLKEGALKNYQDSTIPIRNR